MNNAVDIKAALKSYRLKTEIREAKRNLLKKLNDNHTDQAEIAAAEADLKTAESAAAVYREKLMRYINLLPREEQRMVLQARYVYLCDWATVAKILNYSIRHVQRLHDLALKQLETILCEQKPTAFICTETEGNRNE